MARLTTYPPYVHLSEPEPVQQDEAHRLVEEYLAKSSTDSHLHPDCTFTESGPTAANLGHGGIILHQLRRVEKGLRGVVLKPELDPLLSLDGATDGLGGEAQGAAAQTDFTKQEESVPQSARNTYSPDQAAAPADQDDGDVDMLDGKVMASYQEQLGEQGDGIVEGEIGDRNNAVADGPSAEPPVIQSVSKKRKHAGADEQTAAKNAKKEQRKKQKLEAAEDDRMQHRDETRLEHDSPGPSSTYLPNKVSVSTEGMSQGTSGGQDAPGLQKVRKEPSKSKEDSKPKQSKQAKGGETSKESLNGQKKSKNDKGPVASDPLKEFPTNVEADQPSTMKAHKSSKSKPKENGHSNGTPSGTVSLPAAKANGDAPASDVPSYTPKKRVNIDSSQSKAQSTTKPETSTALNDDNGAAGAESQPKTSRRQRKRALKLASQDSQE